MLFPSTMFGTFDFAGSMPAGTPGAWLADQVVTTGGRKIIPNQMTIATRPL